MAAVLTCLRPIMPPYVPLSAEGFSDHAPVVLHQLTLPYSKTLYNDIPCNDICMYARLL